MPDETRGKFVTMMCRFLETKPAVRDEARKFVLAKAGKEPEKLDPEGWYPIELVTRVLGLLGEHSSEIGAKAAIKLLGRKIYPTMKASGGIPPDIKTPHALVKFEAQGFLLSLRGPSVRPRKVLEEKPTSVVIQADMPAGYLPEFMEGVYQGILEMFNLTNGRVTYENRGGHAVYSVTW
jgi:hypothetical protein